MLSVEAGLVPFPKDVGLGADKRSAGKCDHVNRRVHVHDPNIQGEIYGPSPFSLLVWLGRRCALSEIGASLAVT